LVNFGSAVLYSSQFFLSFAEFIFGTSCSILKSQFRSFSELKLRPTLDRLRMLEHWSLLYNRQWYSAISFFVWTGLQGRQFNLSRAYQINMSGAHICENGTRLLREQYWLCTLLFCIHSSIVRVV
jgi:hypothetical protein